jgi:hypothetical protein
MTTGSIFSPAWKIGVLQKTGPLQALTLGAETS